jgi:hypothetical protein
MRRWSLWGFAHADDGVLFAPLDSVVSFMPVGGFFELKISLADGNAVTAVLSKTAIKIGRVGGSSDGEEHPCAAVRTHLRAVP